MQKRYCSVNHCDSKSHSQPKPSFFVVKENWICLNPLGWKPHKKKRICINHFRQEDILGSKQLFVKHNAIPQIFLNSDYDMPR